MQKINLKFKGQCMSKKIYFVLDYIILYQNYFKIKSNKTYQIFRSRAFMQAHSRENAYQLKTKNKKDFFYVKKIFILKYEPQMYHRFKFFFFRH